VLYARAVQLPHHHQTATSLFATAWVPWRLSSCSSKQLWNNLEVLHSWICLSLLYTLENAGIPSRIFTINTIQPQVLCVTSSGFVKRTKRTSKPMQSIEVLEQTTKKMFSQSSLLMAQLRFFWNLPQDCATSPTMSIMVWRKKKLCSENISLDWQIVEEIRRQKSPGASRIASLLHQPRGLASLRCTDKSSQRKD